MNRAISLFVCFAIAATAIGADAVFFPHDISVRIALKSRLKYPQEFPRPISQSLPEYPIKWRAEGVTGEAKIRFTVSASGAISDVRVTASQKEFGDAAMAAIRRWTFTPGLDVDRKTRIAFDLEYLVLFEKHEE